MLLIEKSLPHSTKCISKEIVQLINSAVYEIILRSGHKLEHFTSLGLHDKEAKDLVAERPESDDDLEIGAALDFYVVVFGYVVVCVLFFLLLYTVFYITYRLIAALFYCEVHTISFNCCI